MASVRLVSITKRFDGVTAVDDVSLDIADREFMVLLGPSGCGKSTLLRMIAGLENPIGRRQVWIGDREVNDIAPKERDVAMVFQSYALYPHKTVQANIEFPLKVRGVDKAARAARPTTAAALLGLEPIPRPQAGGALAAGSASGSRWPGRSCASRPCSAWTSRSSNLDAKLRGETRAELVALHRAARRRRSSTSRTIRSRR